MKEVYAVVKRTRNLFVLASETAELIPRTLEEMQFKGINVSNVDQEITTSDILNTYAQNKSLICANISPDLARKFNPIQITIVSGGSQKFLTPYSRPCIDVSQDIAKQFEKIADALDCDIGDHVSNSSGLDGIPSIEKCGYCQYLADPTREYAKTVYQNEDFFAFTTIGQFILGYLLIIPLEHVMSIAELDSRRKQEFLNVLDDISYILKLTYHTDNILVWENGTGNSGKGKAKDSIVHAHIHVACSHLDEKQIQGISGFPMTSISFEDLSAYGQHSYLLLKDKHDGNWKINDDPSLYIPRQYIRQLLAEEHGIPGEEWNWRKYPFHERRIQATTDIYQALKSNWNTLPDRIKQNTQILMSTF